MESLLKFDIFPDCGGQAPDRVEILRRISELERRRKFDIDVEDDPPALPLDYRKVDYLGAKLSSKIKTAVANRLGYSYFNKMIKRGEVIIDRIEGEENLSALEDGAVITCNHFAPYDNFIVYKAVENHLPKKKLYKVIREGNYTSFKGLYGFLFRNCNTLPLSRSPHGLGAMMKAAHTLLMRGETVLIYPEQAMWWNYRKPRPFKSGAFNMACKADVPVIPVYITMQNDERIGENGFFIQRHTVFIMPPVYPNPSSSLPDAINLMSQTVFRQYVRKYEEFYNTEYDLQI